jgi:glycosyltransferase involved in cell wall biosynthesis
VSAPAVPQLAPCRVLHIASGDLWAGAEAQIHQLLCALQARPDVLVSAVILNPGELAERLSAAGVAVTVLDESSLSVSGVLRGILGAIKVTGAGVVHTHRLKENILGSLAAWLSGQALSVRTVHGRPEQGQETSRKQRLVRAVDRQAGRLQAGIVGVSGELCDYLRAQFPARKVFFVPNGIDSAQIAKTAARGCEYRARSAWNVALVGRLVALKRGDLFLQAAALLSKADPGKYRFSLVGDGPLREELGALAQRLGITAEVDFLGFQGNSAAVLQQMDCLAVTSDHEGLPMVVLEALALGVPVVAHAVGGLPEVLSEVSARRLVDEHTPEGYARAIAELAGSARSGARHSLLPLRFEISDTAGQYVGLYRQLLAQRMS